MSFFWRHGYRLTANGWQLTRRGLENQIASYEFEVRREEGKDRDDTMAALAAARRKLAAM